MKIVQIAPAIGPGSGVAGVAFNLEREWQSRGIETARFTMTEAFGDWLPGTGPGLQGKLAHLVRVVWFSTMGTVLARRYLRHHPGVLSICHNDVLAGDIYVNHGILEAAMRARGHYFLRMLRNPLHIFTLARDHHRYGSRGPHGLIVNLTSIDDDLLRQIHPRLKALTTVIGNGVDTGTYAPASDMVRRAARQAIHLSQSDLVVVFVGHEFERKGLPVLLEAMQALPQTTKLIVVGGTPDLVANGRSSAKRKQVGGRVHFVGGVSDPRPYFHASDIFALPSAYEAFPLVVLEALASGIPVVATPTGCVPDVIRDGVNGYVVPADADAIRDAVTKLQAALGEQVTAAARSSAEEHTWTLVAEQYLAAIRTTAFKSTEQWAGG